MTTRSSGAPLPVPYPSAIEFRLLGPLEVVRDGAPVALGGRRRRSALAILLLNAGRVVSAEQLADDLYAGAAPATAVTQVHRQVSDLRRLLPEMRLETVAPGYVLRVDAAQIDLHRFERLVQDGSEGLEAGDPAAARTALAEALGLWRGPALADLADEPFAVAPAARLEELRLVATERFLESELDLGRTAEAALELETLVAVHPLRERLVELLMLARYRAGRQADALAAYRDHRALLSGELGLEPAPALRQLEAAILRQEVALPAARASTPPVVIAAALNREPSKLAELVAARVRETVLLQLVDDESALTRAAAGLDDRRREAVRTAAFVAGAWMADVVRFASVHDAALVLVDLDAEELATAPPAELLRGAPTDVGLVVRGDVQPKGDVFVLFGGGDHDWAALELAAAAARSTNRPLRLVGTRAGAESRDASLVLADASVAVQRSFGISGSPVLAPRAPDALLAVVDDAGLVVAGIGSRWHADGIGVLRAALISRMTAPVVLVHRGPRPGVLAPRETRTHYTWSAQY